VKFGKCSVVIALMTTQVYAADLPLVSAKPVVAPLREIPVYKWTSFYAGAMFGWGFGRNSINLSGNGPDEAAAIANGLVPSRLPTTRNDWLAGATLGYNYQFGRGFSVSRPTTQGRDSVAVIVFQTLVAKPSMVLVPVGHAA